jgi:hypothetical protein
MKIIKTANDRDDINNFNQRLISDPEFEKAFMEKLRFDPAQIRGVSRRYRGKYSPIAIKALMLKCQTNPYEWLKEAVRLFPDKESEFQRLAMIRVVNDIAINPNLELYQHISEIFPNSTLVEGSFFDILSRRILEATDIEQAYNEAVEVLPNSKLRKTPTQQPKQQPKQPSNWWQRSKDGIGNIINK